MFSKIEVNGANTHPVYRFLRNNSSLFVAREKKASVIPWNFAKFIVNSEGQVVSYHEPSENPLSLEERIKALLKQWEAPTLWKLSLTITSKSAVNKTANDDGKDSFADTRWSPPIPPYFSKENDESSPKFERMETYLNLYHGWNKITCGCLLNLQRTNITRFEVI